MICTEVGAIEVGGGTPREDVRRMLVERRRELLNEIQSRVRVVREVGSTKDHHGSTLIETVEAEPEDDLEFALIQMKSEMLETVNEAVRRFDAGAYGYCLECCEVISPVRLRAMPFAVRCRHCEEAREDEQLRQRIQMQQLPSALGSRY
jgi:DnaK suppressor protein